MRVKIKDIFLPQQEGCQHLHVVIENEQGMSDTKYYHWSDLQTNNLGLLGDILFTKIKAEVDTQKIKDRDEMKAKLKDKEFDV